MAANTVSSERYGKFIRTYKGNLLICMKLYRKEFFFYMTPKGFRFISEHERKRGMYVTAKEWNWALNNWKDSKGNKVQPEELTGDDLRNAEKLRIPIAHNFCFLMSGEDLKSLPKNHQQYFPMPENIENQRNN